MLRDGVAVAVGIVVFQGDSLGNFEGPAEGKHPYFGKSRSMDKYIHKPPQPNH